MAFSESRGGSGTTLLCTRGNYNVSVVETGCRRVGCGGVISDYRGMIQVRRQADIDCVWLLSAPVGTQIRVSTSMLLLSVLNSVLLCHFHFDNNRKVRLSEGLEQSLAGKVKHPQGLYIH